MKGKAFIVDLDGTFCDTSHRQHLVEAKKWDEFYAALVHDPVHQWCDDLVWALTQEMRWKPLFVSGRPEKCRADTVKWFEGLWGITLDDKFKLFTRKDGDFRKDAIVKTEIYVAHIEPYYDIQLCIDDRSQVVDAWRELGLVCLQCAPGNF